MTSSYYEQLRHDRERLKWQLDENTRINAAKAEGKAKGLLEGKVYLIHALLRLLGESPSNSQTLQGASLAELDDLIEGLQTKLRNRPT